MPCALLEALPAPFTHEWIREDRTRPIVRWRPNPELEIFDDKSER